jgi:hypothetical protein
MLIHNNFSFLILSVLRIFYSQYQYISLDSTIRLIFFAKVINKIEDTTILTGFFCYFTKNNTQRHY